ncbi:hypothetical protein BDV29DRAFT_201133 [Aspergillus leporis]|uniref:Uncharacterized protein n=1 Tax=Aspergillus leporis TaxID=41062 RepID=A0A5N5X5W5_9EURO|nr:hypothetical protein BDV29DRAFT_201133 [Aspergillus leporis]
MNTKEQLQQVYLKPCEGATYPTIPQEIHEDARRETAKHYHSLLEELICSSSYSLVSTYNFPPYPLLVSQDQVLHLGKFNDALTHAIDSIVERWWTDREAAFPQRMPLGSVEEDLLRWVQKASEEKLVRRFDIRKGVWHPDFLLGSSNQLKSNGYMIIEHVFASFDAEAPIHVLVSTINSLSMDLFMHLAEQRRAIKPRVIDSSKLRLMKDAQSKTGHALYCIHDRQIVLRSTQTELCSLPQDILRHIAICMLTSEQAELLQLGIAPTIIPGSPELDHLVHRGPNGQCIKNEFVVKPAGLGGCGGITYGRDLTVDEWDSITTSLRGMRQLPN